MIIECNPLRPTVFFKMLLLLYLHEYGKSGGSVFHTNDCEASLRILCRECETEAERAGPGVERREDNAPIHRCQLTTH